MGQLSPLPSQARNSNSSSYFLGEQDLPGGLGRIGASRIDRGSGQTLEGGRQHQQELDHPRQGHLGTRGAGDPF